MKKVLASLLAVSMLGISSLDVSAVKTDDSGNIIGNISTVIAVDENSGNYLLKNGCSVSQEMIDQFAEETFIPKCGDMLYIFAQSIDPCSPGQYVDISCIEYLGTAEKYYNSVKELTVTDARNGVLILEDAEHEKYKLTYDISKEYHSVIDLTQLKTGDTGLFVVNPEKMLYDYDGIENEVIIPVEITSESKKNYYSGNAGRINYNQFFDNDEYTVQTKQFKYWNGSDYAKGECGMRLETELTKANWMVTGVFYEKDGTKPYLYVLSPINQQFSVRGNILASDLADSLEENQVLAVGDLLSVPEMTEQPVDPPVFQLYKTAEYLGHGTEILGDDFMKVIRHELITKCEYFGKTGDALVPDTAGVKVTEGDATEDDKVDILDVIAINKAVLGKGKLNPYSILATDMNRNGKPDASDSLAVMKSIVGLENT